MLRHVGAGHATVWVETDGPCALEILGATERTFEVEGHHLALVHVTGMPAVCSPLRNPLDTRERRTIKLGMARAAEAIGSRLARAAGVAGEPLTWEITDGPWFDNQVATLDLDGRHCTFRVAKALGAGDEQPLLEEVASRHLA